MAEGFNVDIPDAAFDGPSESPETVDAPVAEAATTEASPSTDAVTPGDADQTAESAQDTFDRAYVEQLRQESANYRTQAKPFKETFDGVDESDRDVFLGLVNLYKTDPAAAAREMQRLGQGLLGEDAAPEAPAAESVPVDPKYMTRADYENLRRQEAIEGAARQIEVDAKGLGYEKGTPEYAYLLSAAQSRGGDLNAAHAYIQEREQAAVSKYIQSKEADAAGHPTAPGEATAPVSTERELKTWRDVEAAIDEMF